ncbi:MAG TPA: IS1182 family transposase [Gemmatimonadales bacterium]|nr:IS1182 family transposase [Gemmatimonadales bacterium]
MSKTFREWNPQQSMLFPPSVLDLVPPGHVAHFIRDTVVEDLDLTEILAAYTEERGYPPYHPVMMTALLLYSYSQGLYSSRRMARACEERVDVMAVTGMQRPDFRTINAFRQRHLAALQGLFVQVLRLCQQAGLVALGHVALDSTKIQANASKHKAMSYGRMQKAEAELQAEVARWLKTADATDAQEDAEFGPDRRGDELPPWVANKQERLARIRAAKAALEAEARAAEAAKRAAAGPPPPGAKRGPKFKRPPETPPDKAQYNFTDPESRLMKGADGFVQGYNAQVAVDGAHHIIVAQHLTTNASDVHQLLPLLDQVQRTLGRQPQEVSADAGYCSESNVRALRRRRIRGYIATGRQKHGHAAATRVPGVAPGPGVAAMQRRLRQGGHRSRYRLRKQIAEPVFGIIKQARGFRQFLLRGVRKVTGEWSLLCTSHNLLKLAGACG